MSNPVIYQRSTATGSFQSPDNFKPTTSIKFVRVERDCPANVNRRADGDVRGIIYDFDVLIDGERRAQLKRTYTGKGYTLADADGRAIGADTWRKHLGFEVAKKADFETTVRRFLDAGLIPTVARMVELRAEEAATKDAARAEKVKLRKQGRIEDAAPDLYAALKLCIDKLLESPDWDSRHGPAIAAAKKAVARAEIWNENDDAIVAA